jgi:hypothetical protein
MTGADLNIHEADSAARGRQRVAWAIVLVVLALLLAARALVGSTVGPKGQETTVHGFGTEYVERVERAFREEGGKWIAAPEGSATVRWTEWKEVPPAAYFAAQAADPAQRAIQLSWPRTLGLWAAAFFTLAVLSFLVRDNPAYKFTEAVVVGVSAAYWMITAFWDTLVPKLFNPLMPALVQRHVMPSLPAPGAPPGFGWMESGLGIAPGTTAFLLALIPLGLGVLLLCRLNRKAGWLGIFPLAFIVGTFAGLKFVQFTEADLLAQIATMFKPLVVVQHQAAAVGAAGAGAVAAAPAIDWAGTVGGTLSSVLVFVGVISVLIYFFFSLEHKGVVGRTARVGVWFLMITFGASFGFTVMGRIALLAARFEFLFDDWLWLVDPSGKH